METDDKTGTLDRLGDQALKAATLVSLSKDDSLKLHAEDVQEAIDKCEECVLGTRKVSLGSGISQSAPATAKVLKMLIDAPEHKLSRKRLLQKLWPDCDGIELERVIETLSRNGAIDEPFRDGKDIMYQMKPEIVRSYQKFKTEVN